MSEPREFFLDYPVRRLPELKFLGYRNCLKSQTLDVHTHAAFEVVYVESGWVEWQEERGAPIPVHGQEMSITHPGVPHSGAGLICHPSTFYWLHANLPRQGRNGGRPLLNLPAADAYALAAGYHAIRRPVCRVSPAVITGFKALLETIRRPEPLLETKARGLFTALLVDILRCFSRPENAGETPTLLEVAMRRLTENLTDPPSLQALAQTLHVSVSYLNRQFKQQCGLTPNDYLVRARLSRAKALLAQTEKNLTTVALESGFNTSQYFSSTFKRIEGVTPSAYRHKAR